MKKVFLLSIALIIGVAVSAQDWANFGKYGKANKVKPVICSVLPATAYYWHPHVKGAADEILKLNSLLYQYAKSNRIKYVDFHSLMRDEHNGLPKDFAGDGVHPNINGYQIMEQVIVRYL